MNKMLTNAISLGVVVLGMLPMAQAQANPISAQGTWETTLQGRDLDGNTSTVEAYYDRVLNITWLADADYAKTSGADADGYMLWSQAQAWVGGLNIGGVTQWRLPRMIDVGNDGCNLSNGGTDCGYNVLTTSGSPPYPASTVYSEMASMFYDTLGNLAPVDSSGNSQSGSGLTNTGPFANLLATKYWYGTEYAPTSLNAWNMDVSSGRQSFGTKETAHHHAWAVHDGDVGVAVGVVPAPATVWLFGCGLLGLMGVGLRRRARV